MHKITTYALLVLLLYTTLGSAQNCGTTYTGSYGLLPTAVYGFGGHLTDTCVERGIAVDVVIPFRNYYIFPSQVGNIPVKRLRFDSIANLPCGLCWSTNKTDNSFINGENGCVRIHGTTNDPTGLYKLRIVLRVNSLDTTTNYNLPPADADQGYIYYYIILKNHGGVCATPDTNNHSSDKIASCVLSDIDESSPSYAALTVQPNPMRGEARISFTSDRGGVATLHLMTIVGNEVFSRNIETHSGSNEVNLQRGSLPTGVYILSLQNSSSTQTRRIVLTD